jgi:hypothetical protein
MGTGRLLPALILAAGCRSNDNAIAEHFTQSGHVRFASVTGQPPACAADAPWLDRVLIAQASFLGLHPPDAVTYHYRPYPTPLPCPQGSVGCTEAASLDIFARPPDMAHELVHAIVDASMSPPASFFEEGAAVALGGPDWVDEPAPNYDQPLDPLLGAKDFPSDAFTLAGDFASYLLSTKGAAPYVELLRAAPYGSDPATVRSAFSKAFGRSVDDLVAERRASGLQFTADRLSLPECSLSPTPWSGASWQDTNVVDCAGASIGPLYNTAPSSARSFVTLDAPAAGYYHATLSASGGFAWIHRCSDGDELAFLSFDGAPSGPGKRELLASLRAERHYVSLQAPVAAPATFALRMEPTTAASAGCAAPPPLDVAMDTKGIGLTPAGGEIVVSLRISVGQTWTTRISTSSHLWQCADPCTASTCVEVMQGGTIMFAPGVIYSFRASGSYAELVR